MRLSKMYMPTLREVPQDAEVPSHQLLLRAAMIMKNAAGVYSYLPLGYRVIRKIEAIVREEMDAIGGQEVLMSPLQSKEIWEQSGRWDVYGPEMFKLKDRHDRDFCLGPTAEEYFTTLMKDSVTSYKQLPMNLYQIQTKYRDEKRPRFGVTRAREFIMKDAYTFDRDIPSMEKSYAEIWKAYEKIFNRMALHYTIVAGDAGAMGGNSSHEFIALSEVGEGVIAYNDESGYAATDEKCQVVYPVDESEALLNMEEKYTPNTTSIEAVAKFLGKATNKCLKALAYMAAGKLVLVFIPGDRELNETKLIHYLGIAEHELYFADEQSMVSSGAVAGFTGPVGLTGVRMIGDSRIAKMHNLVAGANKKDAHLVNVNYGRDFECELVDDLLRVQEGDLCPLSGKPLSLARGIEVGNIFQLGQKYSSALKAAFLDENGKEQFFWMGSYGVGITRSMAAVIEQYHDEKGIIWPLSIAPYHVMITLINDRDETQRALAEKIYNELRGKGVEVLFDDRKERPGIKFNDRDLIGIPLRVTVGKKAGEGMVEYSTRKEMENVNLSLSELYAQIEKELKEY